MSKIEDFLSDFPIVDYVGVKFEDKGKFFRITVKDNVTFDIGRVKNKVYVRLIDGFHKWMHNKRVVLEYNIFTMVWLNFLVGWGFTYNDEIPIGVFMTRKFLRFHDLEDFESKTDMYLRWALEDLGFIDEYSDYGIDNLYEKFWIKFEKDIVDLFKYKNI